MTRDYKYRVYATRDERNKFVATELKEYIGASICNIGGGGKKHLKKYLDDNVKYFEIDISGEPDLKIDLEKSIPLDIKDGHFDTVICTDVLEHLNDFHLAFDELIRLSNKYIIISLPNGVKDLLPIFFNKSEKIKDKTSYWGRHSKFYGLPFEKPLDRHKWIFSYSEAVEFIEYQSNKKNLKICELFGTEYYGNNLLDSIRKKGVEILLGKKMREHLFCATLWCVLEKK